MELQEIKMTLVRIERMKSDYESAHNEEDVLYYSVLCAIAEGVENAQELAREAIKASDIKLRRYCA